MGRFDVFNWWKRGVKITSLLTKAPKGSGHPLVWHQIMHGDFRPSPYWEMSLEEISLFKKEVGDYIKKNPYSGKESVDEWSRLRWRVYQKRIEKLRESHIEYESKRLGILKKNLMEAFGEDVWEESILECEGDEMDLYEIYKKNSAEKKYGKKESR